MRHDEECHTAPMVDVRALLRVPSGGLRLADVDPRSTPGFDRGPKHKKRRAADEIAELAPELSELQERLWAHGRTGDSRRLLIVLQGMDTSGKGGAVKHVVGLVDPAGIRIASFGAPTAEERAHDFLWRIDKALPPAGAFGVFDRSHYEDVLIVRVHDLVPEAEWETRYDRINAWEAGLVEQGFVLLKVMLHMSPDEQKERLLARLDDPTKHWKVNPADVVERRSWPAYEQAYEVVLERCSPPSAPWYVLPADRKWYRNWALTHLVLGTLRDLHLDWPTPDGVDLDQVRRDLLAT